MNKFVNIFGIRIDTTSIKKYYVDKLDIIIDVDYLEHPLRIPHNGKSQEGLKILDAIFLYE